MTRETAPHNLLKLLPLLIGQPPRSDRLSQPTHLTLNSDHVPVEREADRHHHPGRQTARHQTRRTFVVSALAMIRRGHRSCSRACGYELARAARQAASPSYHVWHKRVKKARGPASGYPCADCGQPAQDWSTVNPSSGDVRDRFQPRCRTCHRRYDGAAGTGNPRAKLDDDKVRKLRALQAGGLTYKQLAAAFGISDVSACAAVNRKTWAHVT
jgi:hypothetical protein